MTPNVLPTLEASMEAPSNLASPTGLRFIRFGPFQVDQQRQEVVKDGSRLKLQGKVSQALVALLENPGEVVTREELRLRLWPADTHVNYDANVNTTVNKLRQVLGDSTDKPLYIETIPRKGYCLVVRPEFADVPVAVALAAPAYGRNGTPQTESAKSARTELWMTLGIIGLI